MSPTLKPVVLTALNLSPTEKKVFDALTSLKMARNVSDIAKHAQLARTTTAYTLKKLEKRKLSRKVVTKKRTKWLYNKVTNYINKSFM